jgi:IS5 family transposase
MPKQPAFPVLRDAMKKKQTRREVFLSEMEAVVPWGRLLAPSVRVVVRGPTFL